jgi:hypothetical protein
MLVFLIRFDRKGNFLCAKVLFCCGCCCEYYCIRITKTAMSDSETIQECIQTYHEGQEAYKKVISSLSKPSTTDSDSYSLCSYGTPDSFSLENIDAYLAYVCAGEMKVEDYLHGDDKSVFIAGFCDMLGIVAETVGLHKGTGQELFANSATTISTPLDVDTELQCTDAILLVVGKPVGPFLISTFALRRFLCFPSLVCLLSVYFRKGRVVIHDRSDLLFLKDVHGKVNLASLVEHFVPWFDRTFENFPLFVGELKERESKDKFFALLIVFALAFMPFDTNRGYDDHLNFLQQISSDSTMVSVWPIVAIILFGSVDGFVSFCSVVFFCCRYSSFMSGSFLLSCCT